MAVRPPRVLPYQQKLPNLALPGQASSEGAESFVKRLPPSMQGTDTYQAGVDQSQAAATEDMARSLGAGQQPTSMLPPKGTPERDQVVAANMQLSRDLATAKSDADARANDLRLTRGLMVATDPSADKAVRKFMLQSVSQAVGVDPKGEYSKNLQSMVLGMAPESLEAFRGAFVAQVEKARPGAVQEGLNGIFSGKVPVDNLLGQVSQYDAAVRQKADEETRPSPVAMGAMARAPTAPTGGLAEAPQLAALAAAPAAAPSAAPAAAMPAAPPEAAPVATAAGGPPAGEEGEVPLGVADVGRFARPGLSDALGAPPAPTAPVEPPPEVPQEPPVEPPPPPDVPPPPDAGVSADVTAPTPMPTPVEEPTPSPAPVTAAQPTEPAAAMPATPATPAAAAVDATAKPPEQPQFGVVEIPDQWRKAAEQSGDKLAQDIIKKLDQRNAVLQSHAASGAPAIPPGPAAKASGSAFFPTTRTMPLPPGIQPPTAGAEADIGAAHGMGPGAAVGSAGAGAAAAQPPGVVSGPDPRVAGPQAEPSAPAAPTAPPPEPIKDPKTGEVIEAGPPRAPADINAEITAHNAGAAQRSPTAQTYIKPEDRSEPEKNVRRDLSILLGGDPRKETHVGDFPMYDKVTGDPKQQEAMVKGITEKNDALASTMISRQGMANLLKTAKEGGLSGGGVELKFKFMGENVDVGTLSEGGLASWYERMSAIVPKSAVDAVKSMANQYAKDVLATDDYKGFSTKEKAVMQARIEAGFAHLVTNQAIADAGGNPKNISNKDIEFAGQKTGNPNLTYEQNIAIFKDTVQKLVGETQRGLGSVTGRPDLPIDYSKFSPEDRVQLMVMAKRLGPDSAIGGEYDKIAKAEFDDRAIKRGEKTKEYIQPSGNTEEHYRKLQAAESLEKKTEERAKESRAQAGERRAEQTAEQNKAAAARAQEIFEKGSPYQRAKDAQHEAEKAAARAQHERDKMQAAFQNFAKAMQGAVKGISLPAVNLGGGGGEALPQFQPGPRRAPPAIPQLPLGRPTYPRLIK